MNRNHFIKISIAIFIFLGVIISLFPPFEFGKKEKLYDFILGSNKRYFALDTYTFQKKFYKNDSLNYYKNLWSDSKFEFKVVSMDTFVTAIRLLYRIKAHSKSGFDYSDLPDLTGPEHNMYEGIDFMPHLTDGINARIVKYNEDNREAVNYKDVKVEYEKTPRLWDYKYIYNVDSVKKSFVYNIIKPKYYLLKRQILFGELIVEYVLAFFVSIIAGYFFSKWKLKKSV